MNDKKANKSNPENKVPEQDLNQTDKVQAKPQDNVQSKPKADVKAKADLKAKADVQSSAKNKNQSSGEPQKQPKNERSQNKLQDKLNRKADNKKIKEIKKINRASIVKKNNLSRKHGKNVMRGEVVSLTNNRPDVSKNAIELFDVHKWYYTGSVALEALKGINLKIPQGSFVCVLGPSGSGKTTLLNVTSGLDNCEKGDIFVNGYNLSLLNDKLLTRFRRDNVSFIFQQYNLLPNLTAYENARVGANLASKKVTNKELNDLFENIGIKKEMHKFPFQLSGGQQQRVSIARALAKNPKVLFCDEPTGALDEKTGQIIIDTLTRIQKKYNTTIIFVTHNPEIVNKVADMTIRFHDGELTDIQKHNQKSN